MTEVLYQWEHKTGIILGKKFELRSLDSALLLMNDTIDQGLIDDPFDWDLIEITEPNSGYIIT